MGLLDPKADRQETVRAIARLKGENLLLRQAVALLMQQSPQLLQSLKQDAAVLRARERQADAHPAELAGAQDTLDAILRMAQP